MKKKSYRPDEAAEILKVSKRTIYRAIKDGRLTTIAPGINRISAEVMEKILLIPPVKN